MSGVDDKQSEDSDQSESVKKPLSIYDRYKSGNKLVTAKKLGMSFMSTAFLTEYVVSVDATKDADEKFNQKAIVQRFAVNKSRLETGLQCFFGLNTKTISFDFKNFGAPIFRTLYNFIKLPVFLLRSVDFGCRKIIYSEYKDKPVLKALSRVSLLAVVPIHVVALAAYSILNPIVKAPVWIKNGIQSVVASFVAMVRGTNKTADSFRNSEDIIGDTKLRSSSTNSTEWNNPFRASVDIDVNANKKTGYAEVLPPIKEDAKERSLSSSSTSSVLADLEPDDLSQLSVKKSPNTITAAFDEDKTRVDISSQASTDGDSSKEKGREENEGGLHSNDDESSGSFRPGSNVE